MISDKAKISIKSGGPSIRNEITRQPVSDVSGINSKFGTSSRMKPNVESHGIPKKALSRTNSISKPEPSKPVSKYDHNKLAYGYNPAPAKKAAVPVIKKESMTKEPDSLERAMDEQANKTSTRLPVNSSKSGTWAKPSKPQPHTETVAKKEGNEKKLQPSQSLPVEEVARSPSKHVEELSPQVEPLRPTKIAASLSLQSPVQPKESKQAALKITKREVPEVSLMTKTAAEPKASMVMKKPSLGSVGKQTGTSGVSKARPSTRTGVHDEYLAMILQQEEMELNEQLFMIEMLEQKEQHMRTLCPDGVDPDKMTYEELLEMQDRVGKVTVGLSPLQFKKLARESYCPEKHNNSACCVCLNDFEPDQEVVRLCCEHIFDPGCLERWTKENKCCPICKGELVTYTG